MEFFQFPDFVETWAIAYMRDTTLKCWVECIFLCVCIDILFLSVKSIWSVWCYSKLNFSVHFSSRWPVYGELRMEITYYYWVRVYWSLSPLFTFYEIVWCRCWYIFLPFTQTSVLFNFTELFAHVFKYELFEKIYHYYFTFLSPEFCLANFHWKNLSKGLGIFRVVYCLGFSYCLCFVIRPRNVSLYIVYLL